MTPACSSSSTRRMHRRGGWVSASRSSACTWRSRRPYAGDVLPDDLGDHAGLLVLGGAMDSWDDAGSPWLPQTRELVRRAEAEGRPVLGICLGHQVATLALGGDVGRNPAGSTVAVLPVGWGRRGRPTTRCSARPARPRTRCTGTTTSCSAAAGRPGAGDEPGRRCAGGAARAPRVGGAVPPRGGRGDPASPGSPATAPTTRSEARTSSATSPTPGRGRRARARAAGSWPVRSRRCCDRGRPCERQAPPVDEGQAAPARFPRPGGRGGALRARWAGREPLLALLARTADPDAALASLARPRRPAGGRTAATRSCAAVVDDEGTAMRLLSVLGASRRSASTCSGTRSTGVT